MNSKIVGSVLIASILITGGCRTQEGFLGISDDIKDSKKKGVFVREYTTCPNPYKINDSLQITVKEAWLERCWRHTDKRNGVRISKYDSAEYQLCINSVEKDLKGIDFAWSIGTDANKYVHPTSINSLASDCKLPIGDTIDFPVQEGSWSADTTGLRIIGHFVLIKK